MGWGIDFWVFLLLLLRVFLLGVFFRHFLLPMFVRVADSQIDTVISSAVSILLLLSLSIVSGFLPFAVMPWISFFAFAAQLIAVFWILRRHATIVSWLRANWMMAASAGIAVVSASLFWSDVFRKIIGLPSANDGIAHLTLFLKIIEYRTPFINHALHSFPEHFGPQEILFYPVGGHLLAAVFDYWLIEFRWLSPMQVLKAWMTLACASATLIGWWASKRMFSSANPWSHLLVAFIGTSLYAFPYWSADNGGFARALAHAIAMPIAFWIAQLAGTNRSSHFREEILLVSLVLPAVFSVHPTAFGLITASIGLMAIMRTYYSLKNRSQIEIAPFVYPLIGLGLTVALMINGGAFAAADFEGNNSGYRVKTFTWLALWERWYVHYLGSMFEDYWNQAYFSASATETFRITGIIGLCFGLLKGVPRGLRIYPFWFLGVGSVIVATNFVEWRPINAIGDLYFHQVSRIVEFHFLFHCALWAAGVQVVFRICELVRPIFPRAGAVISVLLIVSASTYILIDTKFSAEYNRQRARRFFSVYSTPSWNESRDLLEIAADTDPSTIFIADSRRFDFLPGVAYRRSLFMYFDCPTYYASSNCEARTRLWQAVETEILTLSGQNSDDFVVPSGDRKSDTCLEQLRVFSAPIILGISLEKFRAPNWDERIMQRCTNLTSIRSASNLALIEWRPNSN